MPEVTIQQAKDFLNQISIKDSVAIIQHDDLDGYASGILFSEFCKKKGAEFKNIVFSIGSSQETVIKQTKHFNKILIADLGPSAIPQILEGLKHKEVFYTDHHQVEKPIPKEILEFRTIKEGYIPSSRTVYELVGGKDWLALAGTLADAGHLHKVNEQFIKQILAKYKISQRKFLEQVVFTLNKTLIYFNDRPLKSLKRILKLKTYKDVKALKGYARPIEKEIQKYIKAFKTKHEEIGKVKFYFFSPKYKIKSTVTSQLSFANTHDQFVFATPSKDMIRLSARSQNKEANMITALKVGTKGLENSNAGGHIPAAGGQIMKKDLEKFKENLKNY
jgi:single-stranded DNA-specific DHH superfamily exonuclease